ncbi:MAG: pilus assembly protein PilP [Deltaproteobacteria bacterium]
MKRNPIYMALLLLFSVVCAAPVRGEETPPSVISEPRAPYSSAGKRDPFRPFIKIIQEAEIKPQQINLPPIKKYPLEEFRITGILQETGQNPKVMIVDPEKNTYVLGVGDEIGNSQGTIIEVKGRGIVVRERRVFEDIYGEIKTEVSTAVLAFRQE